MRFVETPIAGAYVVESERVHDERGYFARLWSADEFGAAGLAATVVETSTSFNVSAGTIRGMHWQREPHAETKLVRCTRGAIHDVIVDVRSESTTFARWFAVRLTESDPQTLCIPPGVAHGFQTLVDRSEVHYQMSAPYHPPAGAGVRYDDPALAIEWPLAPTVVSDRDRSWPPFEETVAGPRRS